MSESLDKLLECAYACDFCTLEIPSMVEYRNEQRTKKRVQNFFKKIFDVYIELVPRTTPKSWIIRKIENSDAGSRLQVAGFAHLRTERKAGTLSVEPNGYGIDAGTI